MHTAHRLHILHEGHPALLNDKSGLFTAGNDNSAKSEIFRAISFNNPYTYLLLSFEESPGEKKGRRRGRKREGRRSRRDET